MTTENTSLETGKPIDLAASTQNPDFQKIIIIVGKVLQKEIGGLIDLREQRNHSEAISYMILTGILATGTSPEANWQRKDDRHQREDPNILAVSAKHLEEILKNLSRENHKPPISTNGAEQEFYESMITDLFSYSIGKLLSSRSSFESRNAFASYQLLQSTISIAESLLEKKITKEWLDKILPDLLDSLYIREFTNKSEKVFSSPRAFAQYTINSLLLFNPDLSGTKLEEVLRDRYQK
jgi:hypothetical protein